MCTLVGDNNLRCFVAVSESCMVLMSLQISCVFVRVAGVSVVCVGKRVFVRDAHLFVVGKMWLSIDGLLHKKWEEGPSL